MLKRIFQVCLIVLIFQTVSLSQSSGYYSWLGKSSKQLVKSMGKPADILNQGDYDLYVYKYQLGYRGFQVIGSQITVINTTSYWPTRTKAINALKYNVKMYRNDGFSIEQLSDDHYTASSSKYFVDLEVSPYENGYQASETVEKR